MSEAFGKVALLYIGAACLASLGGFGLAPLIVVAVVLVVAKHFFNALSSIN